MVHRHDITIEVWLYERKDKYVRIVLVRYNNNNNNKDFIRFVWITLIILTIFI